MSSALEHAEEQWKQERDTLITALRECVVALSEIVDIVGNSTWKGYVDKDWPGFKIERTAHDPITKSTSLLERYK